MNQPRICVFPGSFDPVTLGHVDIIERAAALFDSVIVAVLHNQEKRAMFSPKQRVAMLEQACASISGISIAAYDGLLTDYAHSIGACAIVRGLRSPSDFDYEQQVAAAYRHLAPEITTFFLPADPQFAHLSSSMLKQIALLGGDISGMAPPAIVAEVLAKVPSIRKQP